METKCAYPKTGPSVWTSKDLVLNIAQPAGNPSMKLFTSPTCPAWCGCLTSLLNNSSEAGAAQTISRERHLSSPTILAGVKRSTQQERYSIYFGPLSPSWSSWVKAMSTSIDTTVGCNPRANFLKVPVIFRGCAHPWGKMNCKISLWNTVRQINPKRCTEEFHRKTG